MVIDVLKFKSIVEKVCKKYIDRNGQYLDTAQDCFWYVDMSEAVDFSKSPESLCVGSLKDDYSTLEKVLDEEREINILDLDRISDLFKLISFEIENRKDKML